MNKELIQKIIRCEIVGIIFMGVITLQGVSSLREAQQTIFMLASISLFSLILGNLWIILFLCWTVFLYSFFKFQGGIYLSNIFFGCLLYYITKIGFKKEHINFFINGFLWFVFANIIYMFVQMAGLDFMYAHKFFDKDIQKTIINSLPVGFMGHRSTIAVLLALAVPLLAVKKRKTAFFGVCGMLALLIVLKTFLAFFMAIIAILFVLFYRFSFKIPKRTWIILIITLLSISIFYSQYIDGPGEERYMQWKNILSYCMVHPVTGWGLDSYRNITPQKNFKFSQPLLKLTDDFGILQIWDNPHNLYISLFFEFGFIGLFLLAGYIRQNVLRFQKSAKELTVIGLAGFIVVFLGTSLGHFPIFLSRCAVFIIPMFALFEISTQQNGRL